MELNDLCVDAEASLLDALKVMDRNAQGAAFVLKVGIFHGVLTDGDVRRALIRGADKNESVERLCNTNAVSFHIDTPESAVQATLSKKIRLIPLLNDRGEVIDYASIYRLRRFPILEPQLQGNELQYVTECIKTNWISSQGAYVKRFEAAVAEYSEARYCLATSSGTTALHLAMAALHIGSGDEVIVPDLTFGACVNAILHTGATPVLVDVEEDTWNISPRAVAEAVTDRTRAIMPVHLYGNPCDMGALLDIAKRHNLLVIEDCAEALGSRIGGKPVGGLGDAAAFSFFGNKVITCGEGGAVLFKDEGAFRLASVLRDHGMQNGRRYWHTNVGYNYRLTNMQAAVGCAQLEQLETFRKRREEIFTLYDSELIKTTDHEFEKQKIAAGNDQSFWLYTILKQRRSEVSSKDLIEKLKNRGIDTRPIFYPMHKMPAFKGRCRAGKLRVSTDISNRGLSLPTYVALSDEEVLEIARLVKDIIAHRQLTSDTSR